MADRPGLVLQNEEEAPAALLAEWLRDRGIAHTTVRAWEEVVPDEPREHDWVVALGTSDSATQTEPAWIPAEIEFLGRAVDADVPVLGICFGGQALSVALGGEISPADPVSMGWFEVETDDRRLIPPGPWLHFNYERFSIPEGAAQIATSPSGPGAFRLGPHLGIQFHPEVTPAIIDSWAESESAKLADRGLDLDGLRAQTRRLAKRAAAEAFELFDAWRMLAAAPAR